MSIADDFLRRRQPGTTAAATQPAALDLSFLQRRPASPRPYADPVRTGDPVRDLSEHPIRGGGEQSGMLRTPVEFVRGRRVLNDESPSVRIGSPQTDSGAAHLTLTWQIQQTGMIRRSTDIHLGCLWQTTDGEIGAIQSYGNQVRAPRSGPALLSLGARSETAGETLTMALTQLPQLRRAVIYLYAHSGHPDWAALLPVLTMSLADARIELGVGTPPPGTTICALASLHRVQDTLVLRREAEYLRGQQAAVGTAYGFEMSWSSGHVMPGR